MSRAVLDKIIGDLASIDYAKSICLNLYNEPTSNREVLLTSIAQIRRALPKSDIYFSSNVHIFGKLKYKLQDITIFTQNYEKVGSTRAGAMTNVEVTHLRSSPCDRPFETVTVAHTGEVFPCCHFYPDLAESTVRHWQHGEHSFYLRCVLLRSYGGLAALAIPVWCEGEAV